MFLRMTTLKMVTFLEESSMVLVKPSSQTETSIKVNSAMVSFLVKVLSSTKSLVAIKLFTLEASGEIREMARVR
jgi:hypothetical protein